MTPAHLTRATTTHLFRRPKIDAIVIGSGPGGLSTAAFLARRGKVVVVLEANEALGGGLHTWADKGVQFETGFHYLGEVQLESSPLRRIIEYVAPGLQWAAMADCPHTPGVYDEVNVNSDGTCLSLRPGEGSWEAELCRAFPAEVPSQIEILPECSSDNTAHAPDAA